MKDELVKEKIKCALIGGILLGMGVMIVTYMAVSRPSALVNTFPWNALMPLLTFGLGGFNVYLAFRNGKGALTDNNNN